MNTNKRLKLHILAATSDFWKAEWFFGAKKGDGDYHGEMDANNFEKWLKKILEIVEPESVIVMDNILYHSILVDRVPNMSWRKANIQEWLQGKNICYKENEIKPQLIMKSNKADYTSIVVDNMAARKNVIVLLLPYYYHCELNPIELIRVQLNSLVGMNNKLLKCLR